MEVQGLLQSGDLPESANAAVHARANASSEREASVLVPLYFDQQQWHVLYIRRVQRDGDRHSGQVAFPGGTRDDSDANATAAALREAHEEVDLNPAEVQVIAQLPAYHTISNFAVTPVVGLVPWPYGYRPQPTEVARIFSIPLRWLASAENVEVRDRVFRTGDDKTIRAGEFKVIYFKRYDSELLWGATARMTVSFLNALRSGEVTLPER